MELWGRNTAASKTLTTTNSAEINTVLRELVELLEDYAPMWYTEDLHNRAAAALGDLQPVM